MCAIRLVHACIGGFSFSSNGILVAQDTMVHCVCVVCADSAPARSAWQVTHDLR